MEAYWRHRYASLQAQFICDHLKVVLPPPPGTLLSVNAIMHVHRILRADYRVGPPRAVSFGKRAAVPPGSPMA